MKNQPMASAIKKLIFCCESNQLRLAYEDREWSSEYDAWVYIEDELYKHLKKYDED